MSVLTDTLYPMDVLFACIICMDCKPVFYVETTSVTFDYWVFLWTSELSWMSPLRISILKGHTPTPAIFVWNRTDVQVDHWKWILNDVAVDFHNKIYTVISSIWWEPRCSTVLIRLLLWPVLRSDSLSASDDRSFDLLNVTQTYLTVTLLGNYLFMKHTHKENKLT